MLDHTRNGSGSYGPLLAAWRVIKLATDHSAAEPSVSTKPIKLMLPLPSPRAMAITPRPALATIRPIHCQGLGCSRKNSAPSSIEINACACSTTEAMPAGMPSASPANSRPNCPTPCTRPYKASSRQVRLAGLRINSKNGSDAKQKRIADSSRGESSCSPSFMGTKFTPQITITSSAQPQSARRIIRRLRLSSD